MRTAAMDDYFFNEIKSHPPKAAGPNPLLVDAKAAGPELLLPLPNRNSYSP